VRKESMATITRLEDIEIWQLARKYAKDINQLLKTEPFRYEFGLKEQMKNSSGSIMDNIAEGFGRGSKNEFVNFLTVAKGSAEESRSQLYRCLDCDLIDQTKHNELNGRLPHGYSRCYGTKAMIFWMYYSITTPMRKHK